MTAPQLSSKEFPFIGVTEAELMARWDSWRSYIAEGGKGSWPRDAFESLLDAVGDLEAAFSDLQDAYEDREKDLAQEKLNYEGLQAKCIELEKDSLRLLDDLDSQTNLINLQAKQINKLNAEVQHWKANHAAQVERTRILIDRPDCPLERVQAYKLVEDLQFKLREHERLHFELQRVLFPNGDGPSHPSLCDLVAYVRGDLRRLSAERDVLRRNVETMQREIQHLTDAVNDKPNRLSVALMHDNHTFTIFDKEKTLDEIIAAATKIQREEGYTMLCPIILLRDKKEITRVGTGACGMEADNLTYWDEQVAIWRNRVELNADVIRLLNERNNAENNK